MRTSIKIGDSVIADGDIFKITALQGCSETFPDCYRGVTKTGSHGLIEPEEIQHVMPLTWRDINDSD